MSDSAPPRPSRTADDAVGEHAPEIRERLHAAHNHLGVVVAHLDLLAAHEDLSPEVQAGVQEALVACVAVVDELRAVHEVLRRRRG